MSHCFRIVYEGPVQLLFSVGGFVRRLSCATELVQLLSSAGPAQLESCARESSQLLPCVATARLNAASEVV